MSNQILIVDNQQSVVQNVALMHVFPRSTAGIGKGVRHMAWLEIVGGKHILIVRSTMVHLVWLDSAGGTQVLYAVSLRY